MGGLGEDSPGIRPSQVFERLDDQQASLLLPSGALELLRLVDPERLRGSERAKTLGQILSLELAVDDPSRRAILLDSLPTRKVRELEKRTRFRISEIKEEELGRSLRRTVLGFFGSATAAVRTEESPARIKTVEPKRGLFAHQKRAAAAVERFLYFEDNRVLLHLPTGVGKTRTAMSVVASHLRSRNSGLVLWLAATQELLEQAAAEFESTWEFLGDRPVTCLRYWSQFDGAPEDIKDGIIVAGLRKIHAFGKQRKRLWKLGDRTTMVVFDEAHQAIARTYKDIVETIVTRKPRTPFLGLSATPGRTWGDPQKDAAVANLFYGNKVMIECEGRNPIEWLTREGYLAKVEFSLLNVQPGLQLSSSDLAQLSVALDIPATLSNRLCEDVQRNLRIVQRLLELVENHARILVFAGSVSSALLLAGVCRGVGLRADAVTSNTGVLERQRIVERFKRNGGPHRVLINYGVLTTGFDAPAASAALIARPTKSLVLYNQMVGRVIRGPKAGGSRECQVITVVDTSLPGFRDIAEAFLNWEDIWTKE